MNRAPRRWKRGTGATSAAGAVPRGGSPRRGSTGGGELIAGYHPVREALLARGRDLGKIWIAEDRQDGRAAEILRLARAAGVPVQRLPAPALKRLLPAGLVHQGVLAEVTGARYTDAETLLARSDPRALYLVLDEVQDPHNLGAILRTAAAVGATGAFIPLHRAAAVTPAAVRASAGGAEVLPVARVPNLARTLLEMGERGIQRVGLDPGANDLYTSMPPEGPVALVLGGEERGLRPSVREACDRLVRVPLPGPIGSLNVSVTAALALYEVLRARSGKSFAGY